MPRRQWGEEAGRGEGAGPVPGGQAASCQGQAQYRKDGVWDSMQPLQAPRPPFLC